MNTGEYLNRIGVDPGEILPNAESLARLQLAHLLHVPFENLDIHWHRRIELDTSRFYNKIVVENRGGFCYELNGLFCVLLRELGFTARLVSAKVYIGERGYSPEFSHAAIIVTIGEIEYLVDVGFGDFTSGPLMLTPGIEQSDREGKFLMDRHEEGRLVAIKLNRDGPIPQYSFGMLGKELSEFDEMCDFQQTSPESHFTQGKVCSMLTAGGRKTLTDTRFIVTTNGSKVETTVDSEDEFNAILKREFEIERIH